MNGIFLRKSESGFTIVELLIVVVVIAILAAITIVSYNGIQRSAHESAVKSELRQAGNRVMAYHAEKGAYPASLSDISIATSSSSATFQYTRSSDDFCLMATPTTAGIATYHIDQDGQLKTGTCGPAVTAASCFGFNASTGTITAYYNNEGNNGANPACPRAVNIPSTIGGVAVTRIGTYGMSGVGLTSVILPGSITTLDGYAFMYNSLTSITLSNGLVTINENAFTGNQLTNVILPGTVTTIGNNAFASNQITNVTIPNSVTTIGIGAFAFNRLATLSIPNSVTSIGAMAFTDNQLPDNQAFIYKRNSNGTSDTTVLVSYGGAKRSGVVVPNGVTLIGPNAFNGVSLSSITIPSSVQTIGASAFFNTFLPSVSIPTATTLGANAFDFDTVVTRY